MTPHNYEIVDCGAFCEVIFSASRPRICLGTFSTVSPEILFLGFSFVIQHFKSKSCIMQMNIFEF